MVSRRRGAAGSPGVETGDGWGLENRMRLERWYGGEGGIRTRERRLTPTRFPVAPVRPLRHLSSTARHSGPNPGRRPFGACRSSGPGPHVAPLVIIAGGRRGCLPGSLEAATNGPHDAAFCRGWAVPPATGEWSARGGRRPPRADLPEQLPHGGGGAVQPPG